MLKRPTGNIALGVALTIIIVGLAALYFLHQKEQLRQTKLHELSAIAQLKVHEVSSWREQHVNNARVLVRNPFTARAVRDFLAAPSDPQLRSSIEGWVKNYASHYGYHSVQILDNQGNLLLSQPEKRGLDPQSLKQLLTSSVSSTPIYTDLRRDSDGHIMLTLFSRIPDYDQPNRYLGFFVIRMDAAKFLFPDIQFWPSPTLTAEAFLVERQGDEVVFLSEMRHRKGIPFNFRKPLSTKGLPAAVAVRERVGITEGTDYAGAPVLAAFQEVPGTPWVLLAKINRSEAYGDLRQVVVLLGAVATSLLVVVWVLVLQYAGGEGSAGELGRFGLTRPRRTLITIGAGLAISVAVVFLLGYVTYSKMRTSFEYDEGLRRARLLKFESETLFSLVKDAESGQRGYLITGKPEYLAPYDAAVPELPRKVESVRRLMEGQESLRKKLDGIERLLNDRMLLLQKGLDTRARAGSEAAFKTVASGRGKSVMDEIRTQMDELQQSEQQLIDVWQAARKKNVDETLQTLLAVSLVAAALIFFAVFLVLKQLAARARLEESEGRFRAIFDNAGVGILETSGELDDHFVAANDRICDILGYQRHELVGMTASQLTAPEDRPLSLEMNRQVHEGVKTLVAYDKRYLKRDGTPLWVRVNISAVLDAARNWTRSITTVEDISARKSAEEALLAQKEQLEELTRLLEYAPVLVRNLQDEITIWNSGMETMYGFTVQDAVGTVSHDLLQTVFPQPLEEIRETVARSGRWQGELVHKTKDGRVLTVSSLWVLHAAAEGKATTIIEINSDVTPLREAQAAAREAEEKLRVAAEAAEIGTWHWDLRTDVHTWDRRCYELFNRVGAGPVNLDMFLQQIHHEDRAKVQTAIATSIEQKSEYVAEMRVRRPDGGWRWVLGKGRASYDRNGDPVYMNGIVMDVTQRKEAELHNILLAAVVESAGEAIVTLSDDAQGIIQTWNKGAERIFGYTAEEVLGRSLDLLLPPGYEDDMSGLLSTVRKGGSVEGHDTLRSKKDGTIITVSLNVSPVKDPEGHLVAVSAIATDISRRKEAEAQLRSSEEQFRQLAEALPSFVWFSRADGSLEYLNTIWYSYTGASPESSLGWGWLDFLHPDDYRETLEQWQQSIETGSLFEVEHRFRSADGSYHWYMGRAVAVRKGDGTILRWFGTSTDIQDQKRARDAAEAAARAKSDFLANMSHEIRTPMNGILGMADLLLDTELDPLQRQYMEMLRTSGEGLLSVVNDVLDFSKLEAGNMALDVVEFDLRDTIEKTVEAVAVLAFRKQLELTAVIQPGLPHFFLGDPAKLRQVVLNLLGNAVKFTERGEVAVHVAGEPTGGDRWGLRLSVTDTGVGIPEDKIDIIFESFSQADTTTARTYGGTGLGLAISRRLVEQMGGRITVASEVGRGSTFTVDLELPKSDRVHEVAAGSLSHFGRRVLVLDDNATNRSMLETLLTLKGFVVETAETGSEALDKATRAAEAGEPFDLMFIDLYLPDIDGFQVAERLRLRFPIEKLGIMMITSDDIVGGARRARELGMAAYLIKPIRAAAVEQALRQLGMTDEATDVAATGGGVKEPAASEVPFCTHVLLVEDNPVNLTVCETLLRKAGVRVTAATNGIEAVDAYRDGMFDLVLMDVQMPEMDGFEATRTLRSRGAEVPIIGLTAHALEGDRQRCLAAGMDDYVAKPVSAQALREKVAYWAQHRPVQPFNPVFLLEQVGESREAFELVIESFLDNAPSQLAAITDAAEAGDVAGLERSAHRMKGALGVVTAFRAHCLAEAVETAAKEGDLTSAVKVVASLKEETARVIERLQETLNERRQ